MCPYVHTSIVLFHFTLFMFFERHEVTRFVQRFNCFSFFLFGFIILLVISQL